MQAARNLASGLYARQRLRKHLFCTMSDATNMIAELIQAIRRETADLRAENADCRHQNAALEEQNSRLIIENAALKRINRQLQDQALTDQMTGISNYRAFREQLEHVFPLARRHKLSLSLILMDVDRFKQFNDTYGHPAGDARLRQLARLMQQHIRQSDFVARYGGEEFVFILPATDAIGALHQAERLRQIIEQANGENASLSDVNAQNVPMTGSFGVSTLHTDTADVDAMIDEADIALYACKQSGRNSALHFDTLTSEQRARSARSRPAPPAP